MKFKLSLLFLMFIFNFSFASFPVKRAEIVDTTVKKENVISKKSELAPSPILSSEKSQGIALILALTLGLLAAHRWYVGTPWPINVFFIMSLGGVGIWLLIDIIRICMGTFNPKGRFKKSFF